MRDAEIHSAKGPKALENLFCPKGLQAPLLNAPSSSFPQPFPFPLPCTLQNKFCSPSIATSPCTCSPKAFLGQEGAGRWVQTVCSRQREGSIPAWRAAHLLPAPPGLENLSRPPPRQDQLCPSVLHAARQGNCKKVAERVETRR